MAGNLSYLPKFKDVRNSLTTHATKKFPVLKLEGKTTIAIHHSLTKQGLGGSNAEGYARFHVNTHDWPGIGYSYVIEPDGTIKFCNDIELRTYHVGNHNNYAVGICLTGDFRTEEPTKEQEESLRLLVEALQKEYPHLKDIKGHNEFSGYAWKECPVFDYKKVLSQKGKVDKPEQLPNTYEIQEGDTFWSIAKGLNITVDNIKKANPDLDPTKLQVGQKINLAVAKEDITEEKKETTTPSKSEVKSEAKTESTYTGNSIVSYLNNIGEDSSFTNRAKLAKDYGINNYKGTAEQNLDLLEKLRNGKPEPSKQASTTTTAKGDMKTGSIVTYLNSIGADSSYSNRAKLAAENGINNYKGTAEQNTQLLNILRGESNNSTSTPKKAQNPYDGKWVRAKTSVNFYDSPRWDNPSGVVKSGQGFPTVLGKLKVGNGYQYKVQNSNGKTFYITANSQFTYLSNK